MTDANELRALVAKKLRDYFPQWGSGMLGDEESIELADQILALIASREAAVKPLGDDAGLAKRLKRAETEAAQWRNAYQCAFDQAMENGASANARRTEAETLTRELDKAREALIAFKDAARLPPNVTRSKRCTVPAAIYHQVCVALSATTDLGRDTENAG